MRPASVTPSGYGYKAIAIFELADLPIGSQDRLAVFQAMVDMFSEKSITRKCEELVQRGYIICPAGTSWDQSSLTDKGRQALESSAMSV